MKRLALSTLLGLAMLAGCKPSPPPGEKLSAAEIAKVEANATSIGHTELVGDFAIYTGSDGKFAIKMVFVEDTGSYRITEDGHFCLKFDHAFDAGEYCNTIYRDGQTYHSVGPDDSIVVTYTMTPGNPRNLKIAGLP
jgi:hypothetical protein